MPSSTLMTKEFAWRRVHSLMGLWILLFLCEHLLTNSQAALWAGGEGRGFVRMVNTLHHIPYLSWIEAFLIGIPILVHALFGIQYALSAKNNTKSSDGSKPSIPRGRNRAFRWQRITSWIILFGLLFHVAKFRFLDYPWGFSMGSSSLYCVKVENDPKLYSLAANFGLSLYGEKEIEKEKENLKMQTPSSNLYSLGEDTSSDFSSEQFSLVKSANSLEFKEKFVAMLEKKRLSSHEILAVSPDFGSVTLFSVRSCFLSLPYAIFYTIFLLCTCFHACNGLWTFLITWGFLVKQATQKSGVKLSYIIMTLLSLLGLLAIWGGR